MRVLVTGNRGYIGNIMVPMLRNRGHEVVGLDSDLYARSTFGDSIPEVETIRCDIRDATVELFRGYDAVIHLAGLSNDPLGDFNPSLTEDINHLATVRLGALAKQAGVPRFIFSSSCSTYGAAGDDFLDETSAFNPVTPYGKSKVDSEAGLAKLADDGFTPVFMRSATAYGVSPRLRFDLVVNNLTAWAYTTGQVLLKSDGTPWRPIVHIGDISRAFIAALEAPREAVHLQAFNVGRTDENFRIRELAEIVTQVVPGSRLEYAPGAGPDKRCYRVDCEKIRRVLPAFEPQWTARKGVEELYKAYCDVGLTLGDFEGRRFHRLAHLKYLIEDRIIADDLRHLKQVSERSDGLVRAAAGN
jgi:nucleoside-diphosphate-sugar epimerase